MSRHHTADYYDDLEKTLSHAHRQLCRAVEHSASPLRTPVLASISQDPAGALSASARIVVMRRFDPEKRCFSFHTDARSTKVGEIKKYPAVSAVFYDPDQRIQLRLSGHSSIHRDDDETAKIWSTLPARNKAQYGTEPGPGRPLSSGGDYDIRSHAAETHFCVIKVIYHHLEWLYLAPEGHRRAVFQWQQDGELTSQWIVP